MERSRQPEHLALASLYYCFTPLYGQLREGELWVDSRDEADVRSPAALSNLLSLPCRLQLPLLRDLGSLSSLQPVWSFWH